MFKFFTKITADDYGMLMNDTPASRRKVILLANSLFVPVLIWFLSAMTMSMSLFGTSRMKGVIIGIIASIFIFLIDRSIIIANGNRWITGFRLVIGFCIATIGSILVDECFFHDDINQRIESTKEDQIQKAKDGILFQFSPILKVAEANIQETYQRWQSSENDIKLEADGKGGSGNKGVGKITNLKAEISHRIEGEYNRAIANRDSLLKVQEMSNQKAENKILASYGSAMLLKRIEALFDLVLSSKIATFFYLIFTVIIWSLEFLVILFKLKSAETNYEKKIRMIEEIGANRIDKISNREFKWYDGGKFHPANIEWKGKVMSKPPSFYN